MGKLEISPLSLLSLCLLAPRFGGYYSCLVVTCGLSRFTRVFPCNRKSQVSRL